MADYIDVVERLCRTGVGYVDIDERKLTAAKKASEKIMSTLRESALDWKLHRSGEPEPDLGLIHRNGSTATGDVKYFLHYAVDFHAAEDLSDEHRKVIAALKPEFVGVQHLYDYLNTVALGIASELARSYRRRIVHPEALLMNMEECMRISRPYTTTSLRSLWYPPSKTQNGASTHVDRSFLTLHLGDEGGSLIAKDDRNSHVARMISPTNGSAAVFFGVKALYVSGGRLKPLWHGSMMRGADDRKAWVHFVQADIGFSVTNAIDAHTNFYRQYPDCD